MISLIFYLFWQSITNKYFQFKGRANRKEYICFVATYFILECIIDVAENTAKPGSLKTFIEITNTVTFICLTIPSITIIVRRLHDLNLNGYLFTMILLISGFLIFKQTTYTFYSGLIILTLFCLILLIKKGSSGTNKYGEEPK